MTKHHPSMHEVLSLYSNTTDSFFNNAYVANLQAHHAAALHAAAVDDDDTAAAVVDDDTAAAVDDDDTAAAVDDDDSVAADTCCR
jgi:hypothetical protein